MSSPTRRGHNFDGIQSPGVARQGDLAQRRHDGVLGAELTGARHELDLRHERLMAAGRSRQDKIARVRNIDAALTIMHLLSARPGWPGA
jgi:hypothetical protein